VNVLRDSDSVASMLVRRGNVTRPSTSMPR
jgi:hypothetical protein